MAVCSFPSGFTGGALHYYAAFDPQLLHAELYDTLAGAYLWAASLRIRTSAGAKAATAIGNLQVRDRTVFVPVLRSQDAVAFELKVESISGRLVIQVEAAFRGPAGTRVVRVMALAVPVAPDLEGLRSAVDEAALAAFFTKRTASWVTTQGVPEAATALRRHARAAGANGFRVASLYHLLHSLVESPLLRPVYEEGVDGRLSRLINARSLAIVDAVLFLYPRMFAIDTGTEPLPLAQESFNRGRVIVVHTIARIFVWVSPEAEVETVRAFFGADAVPDEVRETGSEESARLAALIAECYAMSGRYLPVEVVHVGSPREAVFRDILVDGAPGGGSTLQGFLTETVGSYP
jgi:hypothetical protein